MLECFALAETHIPFFILILDSKSLLLLLGHTLSAILYLTDYTIVYVSQKTGSQYFRG